MYQYDLYLVLICSKLFLSHLSNSRVLLPKSHNNDAVSLTDAPLSPRGQCVVRLIQNDAMDVFLLAQPARKTVLMDTKEKKSIQQIHHLKQVHIYRETLVPFSMSNLCSGKTWSVTNVNLNMSHELLFSPKHTYPVLQLQASAL